ncbi:hypothetical protein A3G63_02510 [Candidatus Kaiserbacteria bacterium RIFCSPLOWO2_12_FULL_52_8]|uniref:Prepilin-type N-terminal cleavage/methylation domain-containing protein n=1 Tax=Candidatus Kaiserbacteria bacterium RIFCSPHIGHO2_01_FULL_53_31 TaxID=1798481 RepID=A0A1F6CHD6_9BACT|nr:MAG: hypothetical protein A2678_03110 [Candidatus Kaiserbacteria bacterium RIFCSPHIGHO2_01_FULL_53_31]OGG92546.1 MAG: hypothetical protein A3G63_02510 [Candidatus Kaiserbacteria bacterium RIFCSPLOWO2_12_FULL_52_8]
MIRTFKERGFTLIEILVALFILSLTVVFATLIIGSIKIVGDAKYENVAFRIANNKLDELRAGGYDALSAGGPFVDDELANLPQGSASTSITILNEQTKQVMSGVSWRGADGITRVASLTTLVTEFGGL